MPATPAWPPRSAPRLFVATPLALGHSVTLDGTAAHYLGTVMRAAVGSAVILCDDITGEWQAEVGAVARRSITLTIARQLRPREIAPDIWLIVAPVKKPHFDMVLEKATELGVARIVPVLTARCVVDKVNAERARAIITEAAEQCARTALPEIAPIAPLKMLLAQWDVARTLFFADELGGAPALVAFGAAAAAAPNAPAAIMIGPEGGFTDQERALVEGVPAARPISLGPRILRAETAAIAATALWMAACGDWR